MIFLAPSRARAEEQAGAGEAAAEAPPADALVPPEPIQTPLEYPAGETVIADVTLELTVDAEGRVLDARVIEGVAPFSEAARTSALEWRFAPAKREGRAVPARIRYGIRFEPPEEEPEEQPGPEGPGSESVVSVVPLKPRPAPPIEITVSGVRRTLGAVTITREDARALPGTFGDPLRAIEAQPGVVPIVSGLPAFFIRGAPPSNVGFFVDGVDLPLLYHAFLGPSVVHPAMIAGLDFFPGAAPVRFGRFAGPVIAVRTRPIDTRVRLEGALRTIDVGAFAEGPIFGCTEPDDRSCAGEGGRVAARYSYTGLVLSLLGDAKLDYWDYLVEVKRAVSKKDSVGIFAFGAYDFFRAPQEAENTGGELSFHRVDARWDRRFGASSEMRVAITAGYDRAAGAIEDSSVVSDPSVRGRIALSHGMDGGHRIEAGADARFDFYSLETNPRFTSYPHYSTLFPARRDFVTGAYLAAELVVARGIRVAPGVRTDVYRSRGRTAIGVDPRVSAEFDVTRRFRIEHALGIARQRPNFAAQVPGAQVADLTRGLQWALLASSTLRMRLPADFSASAAVYRSAYFDALDPIGGARDFTIDRSTLDRRSTIAAAGLELQVSRPLSHRIGGLLSYTLSRTQTSAGAVEMPSGFDRTHVIQAALGYDFGRGYRAGTRAVFYTGIPELNLEGQPHFTSARRGTPFFRVDLRGEKRWSLGNGAYLGLVAEVMNATSTKEVVRLDCGEICRERVSGPVILPNIGLEAGL